MHLTLKAKLWSGRSPTNQETAKQAHAHKRTYIHHRRAGKVNFHAVLISVDSEAATAQINFARAPGPPPFQAVTLLLVSDGRKLLSER